MPDLRASGLTRFLEEGGTLEGAQNIADHADSRTTKLYDRRQQGRTLTPSEPGATFQKIFALVPINAGTKDWFMPR